MSKTHKTTIAVGMSGGVDSTIAALMLKNQGYHVIGLTMKIWDDSIKCASTKSGCYGPGEAHDIADAERAAEKLGIEHHVIDLRDEYRKTVIDYFRQEYSQGRTPNPCVQCNTKIKFGILLEKAASCGLHYDLFATGHYSRIIYEPDKEKCLLKRGIDSKKDQSYFLYRLNQKQLKSVLFPLGDYYKEEIRVMAEASGFAELIEKRESQDFLEWDNYDTLLGKDSQPGNILDENGNIIGKHAGVTRYTVGQRKMLNLAGMKEPFYVLHIDAVNNEIVAGPKRLLLKDSLIAEDLHWITSLSSILDKKIHAQIRYRSKPSECKIYPEGQNDGIRIKFTKPQEAITPGQSIVFYDGDIVAGGGIIRNAL